MSHEDLQDEVAYDQLRLAQWRNGQAHAGSLSRRDLLRLSAGAGLATVTAVSTVGGLAMPTRAAAAPAAAAAGPIVKPLPPELFYLHGSDVARLPETRMGTDTPGCMLDSEIKPTGGERHAD